MNFRSLGRDRKVVLRVEKCYMTVDGVLRNYGRRQLCAETCSLYDSEVDNEDDGWPREENQWCLLWIYRTIALLVHCSSNSWQRLTQRVRQGRASLPSSLPMWSARPSRSTCGEIKYIASGQAHGVTCHHIHKYHRVGAGPSHRREERDREVED